MLDLRNDLETAIDLLLKVEKCSPKKKKLLDKGKTVYLQVALFKIPFVPSRKRRFIKLCHSLYGEDPEICLFVPNRKTGVEYKKTTDELIDFCVDHYMEILEKHKVKGITTVMPVKQLQSEYGTYEMRRSLVRRFDLFLCKNSLLYNPRFISSLGKIFKVANKEPLGVPFPKEDADYDPEFQKSIERAIYTSSFYINSFSDNYSIPFGCLDNSKTELQENLQAVLDQINQKSIIPGGFENVRAIYLWPSQLKPIPLYISSELPINMKKPTLKIKRKRARGVEGELSTQPHKKVFVTPKGDVFVTALREESVEPEVHDSESEDSFKDESDDEDGEKKENSKSHDKAAENEEESESDDDEEIEEKEMRLLKVKRQAEPDSHPKAEPKPISNETINANGRKERGKNRKRVKETRKEKVKPPKIKKLGKSKVNKSERNLEREECKKGKISMQKNVKVL